MYATVPLALTRFVLRHMKSLYKFVLPRIAEENTGSDLK